MSELHHECGVAAVYHLPGETVSPLCPEHGSQEVSRLLRQEIGGDAAFVVLRGGRYFVSAYNTAVSLATPMVDSQPGTTDGDRSVQMSGP